MEGCKGRINYLFLEIFQERLMSLYYCHLATGKEPRLQFYLRQLEAES